MGLSFRVCNNTSNNLLKATHVYCSSNALKTNKQTNHFLRTDHQHIWEAMYMAANWHFGEPYLSPSVLLLCWATMEKTFYHSCPRRKVCIIMPACFGKSFEIYGWIVLSKNRVLLTIYSFIVQLCG